MGKGRTYELDMVRDITSATNSDLVFAAALDYSGGAADTDADILVQWPQNRDKYQMNLVELKKRGGEGGKRTIVMAGSSDTGFTELARLCDAGPAMAHSWLAVKFANRRLVVLPAGWVYGNVVQKPRDLAETGWPDERIDITSLSADAQRYVRRSKTPYWWEAPDCLERLSPRLTDADSLSMVKPELEWWESSRGADADCRVLLDEMEMSDRYYE